MRAGTGRPLAAMPVALGLALGPAVAIGLARFAYALLLPAMRADLHWSYATAGAINTANALGYLGGALLAAPVARRAGSRRTFLAGIAVTAAALGATAGGGPLALLMALRLLAGAAGALTFIVGAGLAAQLGAGASPRRVALLLGTYFAGGGLGITLSGLILPPLLAAPGPATGWRWGWAVLAAAALAALAGCAPAARALPEPPVPPAGSGRWPVRGLGPLLACYALFGAGYIAYMTFIVALLKHEGAGPGAVVLFWVLLGVCAVGGGFAWAPLLGRLGPGHGPAAVMAVVAVGALLPVLGASPALAAGSAVLFGGSFLSVVTAMTGVVRHALPPHQWTAAIGGLTVAFAGGQCLGPVLAGALSDGPAGVRAGLGLSVGILAVGALAALAQRPLPAFTAHPADGVRAA